MPVGGSVRVSYHESGTTTVKGTKRCGSAAACPICAENIRQRRASELDAVIAAAMADGHHVFLVTATIKHALGDELKVLQSAVQHGWTAAFSGRAMANNGYIGQARAWDFTLGNAGWHPHIHGIIVMSGSVPVDVARAFVDSRFTTYRQGLERKGRTACRSVWSRDDDGISQQVRVGWDVQPVTSDGSVVADYVAGVPKLWSAGAEIALSTHKRASVTPWALLRAAVDGEIEPGTVIAGWTIERLWAAWIEYERATKGRQQIVLGRSLQPFLDRELEDDEDAAQGTDDSPVIYHEDFDHDTWIRFLEAGETYLLLEQVEDRARELSLVAPG